MAKKNKSRNKSGLNCEKGEKPHLVQLNFQFTGMDDGRMYEVSEVVETCKTPEEIKKLVDGEAGVEAYDWLNQETHDYYDRWDELKEEGLSRNEITQRIGLPPREISPEPVHILDQLKKRGIVKKGSIPTVDLDIRL